MIDTTIRQYKIIEETVNLYGGKQYMIAVEEMAELMQAISKFLRIDYSGCDNIARIQKEPINNITAEMADVYIMLEQLQYMFDIKNEDIQAGIDTKLKRQHARNEQFKTRMWCYGRGKVDKDNNRYF